MFLTISNSNILVIVIAIILFFIVFIHNLKSKHKHHLNLLQGDIISERNRLSETLIKLENAKTIIANCKDISNFRFGFKTDTGTELARVVTIRTKIAHSGEVAKVSATVRRKIGDTYQDIPVIIGFKDEAELY